MGQKVWVILLVWACFGMTARAQLKTYPEGLHTGLPHNDDYTVRVRMPGGEWQDVFEYKVQVDLTSRKTLPWYSLIWAVLWR